MMELGKQIEEILETVRQQEAKSLEHTADVFLSCGHEDFASCMEVVRGRVELAVQHAVHQEFTGCVKAFQTLRGKTPSKGGDDVRRWKQSDNARQMAAEPQRASL